MRMRGIAARGPQWNRWFRWVAGSWLVATGVATAGAQTVPDVIRVEEDWLLELVDPSMDLEAPQFHTVTCATDDPEQPFGQVSWNYRELPSFQSGGVQLQMWDGTDYVRRRNVGSTPLSAEAEVISWTQVLEVSGSTLLFGVLNGHGDTWGDFGGEMMTVSYNMGVSNLNRYSPDLSVEGSWVTYGANRVMKVVLLRVRYYGVDGLLAEDDNVRVVCDFSALGDN